MIGSICVNNLGKAFKVYPSHKSRLVEWILPLAGKKHQLKWILNDIHFTVQPGEAVGIIGINGAGKSTLLKMITGTTQPTTGNVDISGYVSALLELGMGFHPDFTGRQNVFMAGQMLGLSTNEIAALMPDIEAFAEIADYLDQPIRVYSSGMQMRLAFSIATAKRPDVLIIDEALSVGDSYFQHKSFDRIRQFRKQGTTLLIVSHDKQAIQAICDRAILLASGRIAMQGEPEAVMDCYNAMLTDNGNPEIRQIKLANGKLQTTSGTNQATVFNVALHDEKNMQIESVNVGQRVTLRISVDINDNLPQMVVGYMIKDRLGQPIFGTNTFHQQQILYDLKKGEKIEYAFTFFANLGEGTYALSTSLHAQDTHNSANFEWRDIALVFHVINYNQNTFVGSSWIPPTIQCSR